MEVVNFVYNDQQIDFEPTGKDDVMVNATQMAKIFGKEVKHFNENESTKNFINSCLNSRNSDYLKLKSKDDLIIAKQKSGTFMHRILALKFAAWLDPDFEVWIFITIDKILNEYYRNQRERLVTKESIKAQIKQEKANLLNDTKYAKVLDLENQLRAIDNQGKVEARKEVKRIQLELIF